MAENFFYEHKRSFVSTPVCRKASVIKLFEPIQYSAVKKSLQSFFAIGWKISRMSEFSLPSFRLVYKIMLVWKDEGLGNK